MKISAMPLIWKAMNNNCKWYFRKYEYNHSFDAAKSTELILSRVQKQLKLMGLGTDFCHVFSFKIEVEFFSLPELTY